MLQDLTPDKIYKIFGNRRFCNYKNFGTTSKDAKFTKGGDPCPSLGEFANLRKHPCGKPLPPSKRSLNKVYMDITYGNVMRKLGYRYTPLLVDKATS